MNRQETIMIFGMITTAYPRTIEGKGDETIGLMIDLWGELFGDISFDVVKKATQAYILSSHFPPTIHDIRKLCVDLTSDKQILSADAWGEVMLAISRFGLNRQEEAIASMTPRTARVVNSMGWRSICISEEENLSVIRAQFMRMYDSIGEYEQKNNLLTDRLRDMIDGVSENTKLIRGEIC